jgi:hypothetical protein
MTKDHARGRRFQHPRKVLAYERYETVEYESMSEVMDMYEIPSTSMLERLIERGGVWKDGYTTFDWAIESPSNQRDNKSS